MDNSFDLSPVIGLLHRLPPPTSENASSVIRSTSSSPRNEDGNKDTCKLGDFTALWQFLDMRKEAEATTVAGSSTDTETKMDGGGGGNFLGINVGGGKTKSSMSQRREVIDLSSNQQARVVTFAPSPAGPTDEYIIKPSAHVTNIITKKTKKARAEHDKAIGGGVKAPTSPVARSVIQPTSSPEIRALNIIQKLLLQFPENKKTLLNPPIRDVKPNTSGIHVFVDYSNIIIGFYDHIKKLRGFGRSDAVRRPAFSYHGLSLILERGRDMAKRVLVGSSPITPAILQARELGYETSILERVEKEYQSSGPSSGSDSAVRKTRKKEQAVDEICHLKILESILDYEPSTIVLASGDGAEAEYSPGFFKCVERCLIKGWKVEVVCFKRNLSNFYRDREFKRKWKNQFRFVALDDFAEDLLG